jgi:hypothetical protein
VDRNTGDKLVAFPDPYAWYSKQAAVVYAVGYNFPFQLPRRDPRPTTLPPRAPSGLPLSLTAQASVSAYRSDTQTFIFTQSAHNEGYFGDDSGGPDDKLCRCVAVMTGLADTPGSSSLTTTWFCATNTARCTLSASIVTCSRLPSRRTPRRALLRLVGARH